MFVGVHVVIYFTACMCVVALEGGQRHKDKKERFVIWQHKMCTNTQTQALTQTKNTHVIKAASLKSAAFEMFTREASTTLEQHSTDSSRKAVGTE